MNKTFKGALGASAAAVLLLGGAGSLAYWTSDATVDGGSITSGTLGIVGQASGTNAPSSCDKWTYATGAANAGKPVVLFVPGDIVTTKCTFKITATGDNLSAKVSAQPTLTASTTATAPSLKITTDATYAISGVTTPRTIVNNDNITSADNGGVLTATFVAKIPYGTDEAATTKVNANDTKSITAALQTLKVSLTQNTPNVSNP